MLTEHITKRIDENSLKLLDFICARVPKKIHKKKWQEFVDKLNPDLSITALQYYLGGSKSKPYLAIELIHSNEKHPFNQWSERCLQGMSIIITGEHPSTLHHPNVYNIGEHAIRRLYERNKLMPDSLGSAILAELRYVPIWANFWFGFAVTQAEQIDGEEIDLNLLTPIIPSKQGLFLCKFDRRIKTIEIRTFINKSMFNQEQYNAWSGMISAQIGLEKSPYAFGAVLCASRLDLPSMWGVIFSSKISSFETLDAISRCVTDKIDNDKTRVITREKVAKKIKLTGVLCDNPSLNIILEYNDGVRELQNQFTKIERNF